MDQFPHIWEMDKVTVKLGGLFETGTVIHSVLFSRSTKQTTFQQCALSWKISSRARSL